MTDFDRYGRADRQIRALRRRLAAKESYETGRFSAGPEHLLALATETEALMYGGGERSIDLDERITAALGERWDEGPEPDVWRKGPR